MTKSSIDYGAVAEQKVAAELLLRGHYVNWSTSDKLPYDFIAECNGNLYRVQVKGTFKKQTAATNCEYRFRLYRGVGNDRYKKGEVDFFILYIHGEDKYYVIPWEETKGKTSININMNSSKYRGYLEAWELLK